MKNKHKKIRFYIAVSVFGLSLSGCGGDGGGGVVGGVDGPTTVTETLSALGVTQDTTPRTYPNGTTIPDTENPLGSKVITPGGMKQELGMVGIGDYFRVINDSLSGPNHTDMLYLGEGSQGSGNGVAGLRNRVAVSANTDGDAKKELLYVGVSGTGSTPYLTMVETRNFDGAYTERALSNINEAPQGSIDYIRQILDMAAGDIDNDGRDEIVVVYQTSTSKAMLIVLDDRDAGYQKLDEIEYPWTQSVTPVSLTRVDMGNVDVDGNAEIAVFYSVSPSSATINAGTAKYYIYDYDGTALVVKATGSVEGDIGGGIVREIMLGDISLGDIDGDGLDEVVMAGVEFFHNFSDAFNNALFLQIALDDAEHGFATLAVFEENQSVNDPVVEPYVETWDPDGNGTDSIQVHGHLFKDFVSSGGVWSKDPAAVDLTTMLGLQSTIGVNYLKARAAMAVGDLDMDGREELILSANNGNCINIIGYLPGTGNYEQRTFGDWSTSCYSGNSPLNSHVIDSNYNPVLVPVDFDGDALALSYAENHDVVYTEPVIIAALAAAPCYSDPAIGQDTSACVTSFGKGESINTSASSHFSLTVAQSIGANVSISIIGIVESIEASLTLSGSSGWEREVSQAITYTGGAMVDSVIFTSIPYDRYFYTIISDPNNAANNGEEVTVLIPREPKTLLVSKDFYNENTPANKVKIGMETFSHAVGDPWSYPTPTTADTWLDDGFVLTNGLLATNAASVSQTGNVEMDLFKTDTYSYGLGFDISFTHEIEIAAVVTKSLSISFGVGGEIGWGNSDSTAVSGSVGAITDPNLFSANAYSWGLGLYPVHNASGEGGEVIYPVVNYWVEP